MNNRKPCFTDLTYGLPIAGTPAPLPCPFCGGEQMGITFDSNSNMLTSVVQCDSCGIQGPMASRDNERPFKDYLDLAQDAARLWNSRPNAVAP